MYMEEHQFVRVKSKRTIVRESLNPLRPGQSARFASDESAGLGTLWQHRSMSFPDPELDRNFPTRFRPPAEILGAIVPIQCVLANTSNSAALGTGLRAYASGLSFVVELRAPHADTSIQSFYEGDGRPRVGIELGDGSLLSPFVPAGEDWPPNQNDGPRGPSLMECGGGGGEIFTLGFWLTPLPREKRLTIVFAWPAGNMPETR
jgi:hypothetical protein